MPSQEELEKEMLQKIGELKKVRETHRSAMAIPGGMAFNDSCYGIRESLKAMAGATKGLMKHPVFNSETDGVRDESEMRANIMLAYRHLEDATMRIGKAVQAFDGGKSVYPR